jgi:hypothetical protein
MAFKVVSAYLVFYNLAQAFGWAIVVGQTLAACYDQLVNGNTRDVYRETAWLVGEDQARMRACKHACALICKYMHALCTSMRVSF